MVVLSLSGADNVRSLKGMPTADGRRINGHHIVRSDQLYRLSFEDWHRLQQLGVKTVCDLRSSGERERYPSRLPADDMQHLHLEVTGDMRADPQIAAMLANHPVAEGARRMMLEVYRRLPAMLAPHLAKLFGLFSSGRAPVLIHCAAGKDRTGVAVALLLHALGVAPQRIMLDYLLSARRFGDLDGERQEAMSNAVNHMVRQPVSVAAIDAVLDARPEYLMAAYAAIDAEFGGIESYLRRFSGLDETGVHTLRNTLLS
ncbi:tyrosine-protein phosphatase [Pseudomonas turukhanskensis]|uniref:Protein-tyrosine-phosphatase n=1 Tax=Pseudomonas turukhanskensis TaxID=1806536 RepID=A0A9W6K367_9PSED|nr:tyrosine-protein phosphatase [Pseudomonas turukhanskensis]GLK88680.1 protein-tyrosine-phosphatase [Pseudomonas turukhanskensis]